MNDTDGKGQTENVVLEFRIDEPPEKVWRAISIAEFRQRWLPGDALIDTEPLSTAPGEEVRYRMRDDEPPYLESIVTFQVRPTTDGGTQLRIIHRLVDAGLSLPTAANSNTRCLMRAA